MRKTKFEPKRIYHVFNRGVEKRNIFLSDSDRWRFLQAMYLFNDETGSFNLLYKLGQEKGKMHFGILREYIKKKKVKRNNLVRIMADCLKPNHYHLLLEELQKSGISRFMQRLGTGYVGYFNKKYERVGPLFQGPFKAVEVKTDEQLAYLLAYINVINPGQELEPELKSQAQDPEEILRFAAHYQWSTHLEYLGKRESIIADKGIADTLFATPAAYKAFVSGIIRGKKTMQLPNAMCIDVS